MDSVAYLSFYSKAVITSYMHLFISKLNTIVNKLILNQEYYNSTVI